MKYEEIEKHNNELIESFKQSLTEQNLSAKAIRNHINNVELYVNDYVLYYHEESAEDGIKWHRISDFFGWHFIRKCMWSTPANIRSTVESIKKFYKYLTENGPVKQEDYEELLYLLKESVDDWCEDCEIFNGDDDYMDF